MPAFFAELTPQTRLTAEQERQLFMCLRSAASHAPQSLASQSLTSLGGDATLIRNRLFEVFRKLAISVVRNFSRQTDVSLDELMSEAHVTLLHAIEKFDPQLGFRFSTYATRALRTNLCRCVTRVKRTRVATLGETDVPDPRRWTWEREYLLKRSLQAVLQLVAQLKPQDAMILRKRYGIDGESRQTLQQIAESLQLSRERVRQLQTRALARLQKLAAEQQIEDPG